MVSLRHKLWLGFGTLLLILLAVSFLTAVVLTRYSHTLEHLFRENYDSVTYCDQMKKAADRLNLRTLFFIWNPAEAGKIDGAAERSVFRTNLDHEFGNLTLPGEAEHTRRLSGLWEIYQRDLPKLEALPPERRGDIYRSTLLPEFTAIHETAQWIADANISNMVSVDGRVKQTLTQVRTALLVLSICGTLAAALAVGAAGQSILRPLRNLMRGARQIESGDLELNLSVRSNDEVGALAAAFNSMAGKLREFRRLDHETLLRARQTTQLAIDSLPDAVFIIGPSGSVEISNRMATIHFGIAPGRTVAALSAELSWLPEIYETARNNQAPAESPGYGSAIQLFEEGRERFLLPRAVPMFGADGSVIGVCVIRVDVTVLRLADEAKSDLVSTVSHELRTPLTSIRMAMNLLSNPQLGTMGTQQAALLEAARQEGDRLYRTIENLLSMRRIESGRAEFQFRAVAVEEIISGAVDTIRPAAAEKRLQLTVNVAPGLPKVMVDSAAIASALTNLLSNAVKFTPAGGEVKVSAGPDDGMVYLTVADTGPGIPQEYADRIFEKFFRVPTHNGPGGAGLGLSIAREIVEAHGGSIRMLRDRPIGCEFRLTLRPADSDIARDRV